MNNTRRAIKLELERLETRDMLSGIMANPSLPWVTQADAPHSAEAATLVGTLLVVSAYSEIGFVRSSPSPPSSAAVFFLIAGQGTFTLSFATNGLAASAETLNAHLVVVTGSAPPVHGDGVPALSVATLRPAARVKVTVQPASVTVSSGSKAIFTANASGYPPPAIQWQVSTNRGKTFTDIVGATASASLTFTAATSQDGNEYRALFISTLGDVATKPATLHVTVAQPAVVAPPANPLPPSNPLPPL